MRNGEANRRGGFTFIELMVVVAVTVILLCLAIPHLTQSITRTKESVLHNNLFTIRMAMHNYCFDKGKCPQSLQDLVAEGYLKTIPTDPMNNDSTQWRTVTEDGTQSLNQDEPGIRDVHSGSDKTSLEGTRYAEW